MTPREFKAWFEGFTEAFDRVPSKAQWERVKARVAEIDGKETTERVYIDRYVNRYFPYYSAVSYQSVLQGTGSAGYSSLTAMNTLGRAEAQSLTIGRPTQGS